MQILRNEVRTGLMVLLTLGLVVGVVLYISSPGLFRPLKSFLVYFDNAAGIKPGAAVMLAGRKIGTVAEIQSPVPLNDRPEHKLNYEAMVRVQVAEDSQIYKETTVADAEFRVAGRTGHRFHQRESGLRPGGTECQIRR